MNRTCTWKSCVAAALVIVTGIWVVGDARSVQGKAEDEVKQAFSDLQIALGAKDPAKIWALIDSDTQSDAEKIAKRIKTGYGKANDTQKAELEKSFGLTADELARVDGKLLMKTKQFIGKYEELADRKGTVITGITVQGDSATVNYTEADGDKVKLNLKRQDGKWKAAMPMPSFSSK